MSGIDEYSMWLERAEENKNVDQLETAYEEYLRRIERLDPVTVAETTDTGYRAEDSIPRIIIPFLYSWFVMDMESFRLRSAHVELDTLPLKVLVLQHLISAAENRGTAVRVMGEWIDLRSLHHGAVLGAHTARDTGDRLNRFFTLDRERRLSRVLAWGGKPIDLGDEGYRFDFFPRLPVVFVNWRADHEFPPYSKILYDVSASNYMPTHGLIALTEFLIYRLSPE